MKKLIAAAGLLVAIPTFASAQNADSHLQGQFYFFAAPIVSNTQYVTLFKPPAQFTQTTKRGGNNTGFGGEVLSRNGVGVGVEFAYAGPDWSYDGGGAVGVGSVDATYHFFGNKSRGRVEPFLTGGYSLYFGQRTTFQSGFNLGGGINLWLVRHAAVRLEIRNQGGINHFQGFSQFTDFVAFRFGMTFR